ncbi:ATPase [Mycolicibacterium conceptionense]|uniref:ATPase n=2 Tax=Mycolicibacterium TaxID=1866885 RepID=A0A0U1CZJ3_9MYCO|nr:MULTISPECIES: SRPBCC family protein [Mycolicibacterium]MCW1819370.1 SRPBCC family protein [Mycolicibacterium senegalense]OBB08618.1 ATPase [Mycolicibacterium conceptionense]OBE92281.1 ATPase [Mycolicibacterium conceptionense]OBF24770.1 ATPase [Mycolicibacterium conceptionense]OBF45034.1 ATPase [Mycolicibacterium conceptionense]
MTPVEVEPIRKSVVVDAAVDRAFTLFIDRFDAIKPREHNLLAVPVAQTVFEPRVGGHIYDVGIDGSRCEWSRVLVYEPPTRVVFSWDIGPTWQIESDPDRTSEVEVRFVPLGPARTRVELEHRHLERHGEGWRSVAGGVGGDAGWPLYLHRYLAVLTAETPGGPQ